MGGRALSIFFENWSLQFSVKTEVSPLLVRRQSRPCLLPELLRPGAGGEGVGGQAAKSRACPAPHCSHVLIGNVAHCRVTKRPRLTYSAHESATWAGLGMSLKAADGAASLREARASPE